MSKFICTTDEDTANQLENEGFVLLSEKDGRYVFLNDTALRFSHEINRKQIEYTSVLYG